MGVKLSTTVEQTLCFPPPSLTQQSVLVKKRCWRWVVGGTHEVAKGSFTESYNYPYYYYWSNIISKTGGNPMRMYLYLHWLPSTGFTRTYFSIPVNSFHENFMDKSTLFFCLHNEVSVTAQRHHISKHVYCFLCRYTLQRGVYSNKYTSYPCTGITVNNLQHKQLEWGE